MTADWTNNLQPLRCWVFSFLLSYLDCLFLNGFQAETASFCQSSFSFPFLSPRACLLILARKTRDIIHHDFRILIKLCWVGMVLNFNLFFFFWALSIQILLRFFSHFVTFLSNPKIYYFMAFWARNPFFQSFQRCGLLRVHWKFNYKRVNEGKKCRAKKKAIQDMKRDQSEASNWNARKWKCQVKHQIESSEKWW